MLITWRYLRILLIAFGATAAAAIAFVGLHNYRATRGLFAADPPSPQLRAPDQTGISGLRNIWLVMEGGIRLAAWYSPSHNGAAVIVTHGTNSDRATMLPELRVLTAAGYGVLAFDWPGLGASEGQIRWDAQARAALESAIEWLAAQPGVNPSRIGGLGFSIGAFVMAQVAARDQRLRALVLEAPPPDFGDYLREHNSRWGIFSLWPARWALRGSGLLEQAVEPITIVDRISPRPLLLVVGSQDQEVPAALVSRVFAAAREPKQLWIVPGARHGGYCKVAPDDFSRRIRAFFAAGLAPSIAPSAGGR